jgi:ADP-ribose pyrophosphatase YjhB (NUDIX family)
MQKGLIRPIAICIIRRGDSILVAEGYDPAKHETFYRPLGGRIEFGETGRQTIVRELREELDAEVVVGRYVCTTENIFTFNASMGHQLVLIYEAEFAEPERFWPGPFHACEDSGEQFLALWQPLSLFREKRAPLYPEQMLEILDGHAPEL